jgi:hypothetical protein
VMAAASARKKTGRRRPARQSDFNKKRPRLFSRDTL